MNYISTDHTAFSGNDIFSSRWARTIARVIILYIFSTIFKSFDLTFIHEIGAYPFRSQIFSLTYVLYGLLAWRGATGISRLVERGMRRKNANSRLLVLCCILLLYGAVVSLGFGFIYAVTDILVFGRYEAWESFAAVSYNMNFGTYLFYVLILAFNGIIFYYKGWKEYQVKTERLMRENIQAKYDALRNQIDPHFFFNSLSVLTNLVYKSPDLSADYITQLAKIYRYILDKKFDNLVTVETELEFLDAYLFLIQIRHHSSIDFTVEIESDVRSKGMIPPATLQMLIENAIKHNRFSINEPLKVTVRSNGHTLVISNNIRKKLTVDSSPGIGLENIRKRYELTTGGPIDISQDEQYFTVKIPVIYL